MSGDGASSIFRAVESTGIGLKDLAISQGPAIPTTMMNTKHSKHHPSHSGETKVHGNNNKTKKSSSNDDINESCDGGSGGGSGGGSWLMEDSFVQLLTELLSVFGVPYSHVSRAAWVELAETLTDEFLPAPKGEIGDFLAQALTGDPGAQQQARSDTELCAQVSSYVC